MKRQPAFTLLEMSIVLFIISLLILIILPNLSRQRQNASRIHRDAMVSVVQTQADAYENETGDTSVSLEQLKQHDYLTAAQVQKAKKEKIAIVNGKAVQR
ncbi:MAG: competence type IV pilus major pilin ComGC [Limosilactobacillus sp.]